MVVIVVKITLFFSRYTMSLDNQNSPKKYQVRSVPSKSAKYSLRPQSCQQKNPNELLAATIKVAREKYVPPGVQVRAWISPCIFTANIYRQSLDALKNDREVVTIETSQNLRSF